MKMLNPFTFPPAMLRTRMIIGAGLFIFTAFFISNPPYDIPAASAGTPYGIQGQMAPELNLSDWIDGNGQKTDAIQLSDYRGKVVYLYFFQDW